MAADILVETSSVNGLVAVRRLAITSTNAHLLFIKPHKT